jgi:REP element-mobilizing transposase RayT
MDWEKYQSKKQWAGDLKPSMKRRRVGHDYQGRCIYMVTLVVKERQPLLCTITGNGDTEPVTVHPTPLGQAVTQSLLNIPQFYPQIEIWTHQLMPDHLHAIVFVKSPIPVHLGKVINGFKVGCNRILRQLKEQGLIMSDQSGLWEEGYNDIILEREGQLRRMKDYIFDNPRRLAIKRTHPDYFQVQRNVKVGDYSFAALGNIFLLDAPCLIQVQCSRSLTVEQITEKCRHFLSQAQNGAVLVSPSISPGEKAIMKAAFEQGYPVIVLQENGFAPLAKPGGRRFDACAQGRMLMLAPWEHHNDRRLIRRDQCLNLNEMASAICLNNNQ